MYGKKGMKAHVLFLSLPGMNWTHSCNRNITILSKRKLNYSVVDYERQYGSRVHVVKKKGQRRSSV